MRLSAFVSAVLVCVALALPPPARAQVLTKTGHTGVVTPEVMSQRFNERADTIVATYPPGITVKRTAQFDLLHPDDAAENIALGGNVIVMIAVMTHETAELPLTRAFFRTVAGVETPLKPVGSSWQRVDPNSSARALYGDFRQDNLYLMPVHLVMSEGAVFVDFAVNRSDFRVFEFPLDAPDYWQAGAESGGAPDPAALDAAVRRNYPGYAVQPGGQ